ncbi:hypothetical protein COE51_01400 [Bacillus pseudomycoides]|nr:hypothetical protein COE51_01400 [Bacillus pseudomycoides]
MSKWERRLDKILKEEKDRLTELRQLEKEIRKQIHDSINISKEFIETTVKEICDGFELRNNQIESINIDPLYKSSENAEFYWKISIVIKGDFNGIITIETSKGWREKKEGKVDIFYVFQQESNIESFKEEKISFYYKGMLNYTSDNFVDLLLDRDFYMKYDDYFKTYEIWSKDMGQYESGIKGDLRLYGGNRGYKSYKKTYDNLNKLYKCDDIKEFAENELYGSEESYTYEWTEYKL